MPSHQRPNRRLLPALASRPKVREIVRDQLQSLRLRRQPRAHRVVSAVHVVQAPMCRKSTQRSIQHWITHSLSSWNGNQTSQMESKKVLMMNQRPEDFAGYQPARVKIFRGLRTIKNETQKIFSGMRTPGSLQLCLTLSHA